MKKMTLEEISTLIADIVIDEVYISYDSLFELFDRHLTENGFWDKDVNSVIDLFVTQWNLKTYWMAYEKVKSKLYSFHDIQLTKDK